MAAWSWCEFTDGSAWRPPAGCAIVLERAIEDRLHCEECGGEGHSTRVFVRCSVCTVQTEVQNFRAEGFGSGDAVGFVFRMTSVDVEPDCVHWTRLLQGSRERKGKR